ncbi:hypothetical protein L484_009105 [Morus notabilis]|uniref:Uncharacterized protein n=1 Tax=Morus notabilis TaxID=981085 RepID=W9RCY2_9ROSA|nr:hypothetical protein L484_009105 [Morus notabilis]
MVERWLQWVPFFCRGIISIFSLLFFVIVLIKTACARLYIVTTEVVSPPSGFNCVPTFVSCLQTVKVVWSG